MIMFIRRSDAHVFVNNVFTMQLIYNSMNDTHPNGVPSRLACREWQFVDKIIKVHSQFKHINDT